MGFPKGIETVLLSFVLLFAVSQVKADCEWDDGVYECRYDDYDLSTGAIVGIAIGALIIIIVIPTLICFCCACLCFKGRRSKGEVHTYIVPAPQPQPPQGTYPQQQTGISNAGYQEAYAAPPPYFQPQNQAGYQNPPYPNNYPQPQPQYQQGPPVGWTATASKSPV